MYVNGQGVVQDYVRAHMWFNLGAVSGKAEKATSNRDSLAAKMTPAQIAEAQKIARECQARSFKDC
jgi:TPR repeat protein